MAEFETCDKCKYQKKEMNEFPCTECVHNTFDRYEPQTNADRIRAMSDERLALLLVVTEFEDVPSEYYDDETQIIFRSVTGKRFYYKEQAIQDNLEWLKKEVEDE